MYRPLPILDPDRAGSCVLGIDPSLTATGLAALSLTDLSLTTAVHHTKPPVENSLSAHAVRHADLVTGIVDQVLGCDPALVVIEGLKFSVSGKDSSTARRGHIWWSVVEMLVNARVPVLEVSPQQIKIMATQRGNASKAEVVAAYSVTWPEAARGANIMDRADASWAAVIAAAVIDPERLPVRLTKPRSRMLDKLDAPTYPPRTGRAPELPSAGDTAA